MPESVIAPQAVTPYTPEPEKPAAAPAAGEKEKAPTPEEIKVMAESNEEEWFGMPKKKAAAKVEEEKKEEKPKEEAKPEPEKKEASKSKLAMEDGTPSAPATPAPASPASQSKPVDEDELVDRIAGRLEEKFKPAPAEKKETKEVVDPYALYGRKEKSQLETLQFLSQSDPKFKGRDLAAETTKFWNAESQYIRNWEKENDGEKFDATAPEHQEFYQRNEPAGITREDLDEGRVRMEVAKEVRKVEQNFERRTQQEINERLVPIERERAVAEKTPVIKQSINASVAEMVATVLPDMVGENGLTAEVIKKIEEEDPMAMELLAEESKALNVRVRELEGMRHLGPHFQFNKELTVRVGNQRITPHADIIHTAIDLEDGIMSKPEEERVVDGKKFITRGERTERIGNIVQSNLSDDEKRRRVAALQQKFWCVEMDDIRAAFVAQSAANVRKTLNITKKRAKLHEEKTAKPVANPQIERLNGRSGNGHSRPPASVGGVSELVNTKVPGSGQPLTQSEINRKEWFD